MSETISAADANRHFSKILRGVREDGTSYVVTAHGKPVAKIVPIAEGQDRALREAAWKKMLERWATQPALNIGRWTRDELYDD
ncbi:MAG: type II toxin-antitoxin system prevent-host-death family antitoxin [Proteobacteria bacterium]|nr:type II toxin-antitoxin system prevent-host-death family antitoxin [Pseudomonadota bacterium]